MELKMVDGKTVYVFRHFTIAELPQEGRRKTRDYVVKNNKDTLLGHIKWFRSWRQHTFHPDAETVWSDGCLGDIKHFLSFIRAARRIFSGPKLEGVKVK